MAQSGVKWNEVDTADEKVMMHENVLSGMDLYM